MTPENMGRIKIIEKLKIHLKQLFCRHDFCLIAWHWTHGINGDQPREIEYKVKCEKCGKVKYGSLLRGSHLEEWYTRHKE